jgi:hypothetical protein
MQFVEDLSDRRAAAAVRGRIDWKYALGLELDDPGFDFSVLCEFRARLTAGGAELIVSPPLATAQPPTWRAGCGAGTATVWHRGTSGARAPA